MRPNPGSPLAALLNGPLRPGEVTWIGLRSARRIPMTPLPRVLLVAGQGLAGDHYKSRRNGPRQVTLIAEENLAAIAGFLGREAVDPGLMRRNIVTRGINLVALKDRRFRIGAAVLEGSGDCAPCGRMETTLGPGGFNAARGQGGITARIIEGGEIAVGDVVERL